MFKNHQNPLLLVFLTSNTIYLTRAKYFEEKRKLLLEFSNCKGKRTKTFPFFPRFYLDKRVPFPELKNILSNYNPQKFALKKRPNSFEVIASTFKDLKCLANLCLEAFGKRPQVIEPERQFLLLKGWAYFDGFEFSNEHPVNLGKSNFPRIKIGPLDDSLQGTLCQMMEQDSRLGENFVKGLALSKILKIPVESVPEKCFEQLELFLENLLFKNSFASFGESSGAGQESVPEFPKNSNSVEMDFSELWPVLLTRPFYNLGFDSLDCDCCKPGGLFKENVLPNSLARARFLSEGLYFKPVVSEFGESFHCRNPLKENRARLKQEFCLPYLPVGPFSRGQESEIMLCDALKLSSEGKAELLDKTELHWFCLKKESFVSKELVRMNRRIVLLLRQLEEIEKNAFQLHGLMAESTLSTNPDFLLKKALLRELRAIYCSVAKHLTNSKSGVFSPSLSNAVSAVQAETMSRFGKLLKEHNGRVLRTSQERALVRTETPMSAAKEFSKREKLPVLISQVKKAPLKRL